MAKNATPPNGGAVVPSRVGSTALSTSMLDEIYAGLSVAQSQTILPGGDPLIKLDKTNGKWALGIDNEPIDDESEWMIDPMSLEHGYICWSPDAVKLGEQMVPMYDRHRPKPARPAPVNGSEWKEQRAFAAVAMSGSHEGTTGLYRASSVGAIKGVDPLVTAIRVQLAKAKEAGASGDDLYVYPIVRLSSSSYNHSNKSYGVIWNPVFVLTGWANAKGKTSGIRPAPEGEAVPRTPKPTPSPAAAAAKPQRKAPARNRASA